MVSQFHRRAEDLIRQAEWACRRFFLGAAAPEDDASAIPKRGGKIG